PRLFGAHAWRAGQHRPEPGGAAQMQAGAHVVEDAQRREHARSLKRADDAAARDVAWPAPAERRAVPGDTATCRSQITRDRIERGRLAGAVGADEAGDRTALHTKGDSGQSGHAAELDPKIFNAQHVRAALRVAATILGTMPRGRKNTQT